MNMRQTYYGPQKQIGDLWQKQQEETEQEEKEGDESCHTPKARGARIQNCVITLPGEF